MKYLHPYCRYGLALTLEENELDDIGGITEEHLIDELLVGLHHFRIMPASPFDNKDEVMFKYMDMTFIQNNKEYQGSGKTDEGIYLAPNVITTDKEARNLWRGVNTLIEKLKAKKPISINVTMSLAAISAKFNNGKKSQSTPKKVIKEVAFAAITNTTPFKPCLVYKTLVKKTWERRNTTLIPDLPLKEMRRFIIVFKKMMNDDSQKDLFLGRVVQNKQSIPMRPKIFNGNFPSAPKSSALSSIALLGAIGEWAKKVGNWNEGKMVLDSLKNTPIYLIEYGLAKTFSYNNHIVELAEKCKLVSILDSIYYSTIYNAPSRNKNKDAFQTFDLFASRFLLLFNRPSFKDFLACRAEYPNQLNILFLTYFIKMEKISEEVVFSAQALGRWLNLVAIIVAKNESKSEAKDDFQKVKAKVLIEFESSIFSAKDGPALIGQVITRAGRLSNLDVPSDAALFMRKISSGELLLNNAKNLLMAFARLRYTSNKETKELEEFESSEDSSMYSEI